MGDASVPATEWGRYLRRMTNRPGWSVAELARQSGVSRQTLFEYIRSGGEPVTIGIVRRIAEALGDDFVTALLAAGNISVHAADEQISSIATSGLSEQEQRDLIEYVEAVRDTQRSAMRAEIETRLKRRAA